MVPNAFFQVRKKKPNKTERYILLCRRISVKLNDILDSAAQSHEIADLVYLKWHDTVNSAASPAVFSARPVEPQPASL